MARTYLVEYKTRNGGDVVVFKDYRRGIDRGTVMISGKTGYGLVLASEKDLKNLKSDLQIRGQFAFESENQATEYQYQLLRLLERSGDESYRGFFQAHFELR